MKKLGEIVLGIIFSMVSLFFLAYVMLFQLGTDQTFFLQQIESNQLEQIVGLDKLEIVKAYEQIFDFSKGDRLTLADSEDQFVYSEKETAHMKDVQGLFLLLERIAWIGLCVGIVILFFALTRRVSGATIWVSSLSSLLVVAVFTGFMMNEFQSAFLRFHQLLFTNDMWLLDPSRDFLIQIMPESFFIEAAKVLFLRILIAYGLLHASLAAIDKLNRYCASRVDQSR
ncbi:TIGR01906 family membrane protein [Gottschalkiaceae bacterium SANA]|nr:TIGR01906 family membrane protein [Gottschalkiaceae bacterium SANA]